LVCSDETPPVTLSSLSDTDDFFVRFEPVSSSGSEASEAEDVDVNDSPVIRLYIGGADSSASDTLADEV
jgi:hypothetical protein